MPSAANGQSRSETDYEREEQPIGYPEDHNALLDVGPVATRCPEVEGSNANEPQSACLMH